MKGIIGRRVKWTGGKGEWVVRASTGAKLRIRRAVGGMSFLVARDTVKFVKGDYEAARQPGERVVRSSRGL
jgi:hypothetical protein